MDGIFDVIRTVLVGFFGFLASLFALALVFGKRIEREWEYEAEFHDKWGNEIGELDIERSRVRGESEDFEPRANLTFKHRSLEAEDVVQVYLDDELILEGKVARDGRVRLTDGDLMSNLERPQVGQTCTIRRGEETLAESVLVRD
ncbi:MAG: hypothetical protein AAF957_12930 [Planctomycetota bacterium]